VGIFSQGRNESPPMRMACRTPGLLEVKLMVCHADYNALYQV